MITKAVSIVRSQMLIVGIVALMFCASIIMMQTPLAKAASVEEMQAQMASLMAQIAALQSQIQAAGGSSSSTAGFPPRPPMGGAQGSTTLQVGTAIVTTEALRVRSAAGLSASFIATQPAHSEGVIVEGPVTLDGYRWFKVDYATGADGWNVGSWLKSNTAPVSGDWAHPPKMGIDGMHGSSSELQAKIAYLKNKFASSSNPAERQEISTLLARFMAQMASSTGAKMTNPLEMWMKNRASTTNALPPRPALPPTRDGHQGSTTEANHASTSGAVLGASTDILTEISATLNDISVTLSQMQ